MLSGHFLDVVGGLTTLKIYGRSKAQLGTIRTVADDYRHRMMAALRVTFLSSLVLELLASVSVALVAVAIGLRLLAGHLGLQTSLFVLVLAPEAYFPLRQLGAEFHASAEGLSAAQQVFEVLDRPSSSRAGGGPMSPTRRGTHWSSNLSASHTPDATIPRWTAPPSRSNREKCWLSPAQAAAGSPLC